MDRPVVQRVGAALIAVKEANSDQSVNERGRVAFPLGHQRDIDLVQPQQNAIGSINGCRDPQVNEIASTVLSEDDPQPLPFPVPPEGHRQANVSVHETSE